MKQYITFEQLNELSEKNIINLHKWWDKTYGTLGDAKYRKPILSIGQMMEFLDDRHYWDCQPEDGKKYGYKDWVTIFKDSCAGEWFISDTDGHRYKKNKGHDRYVDQIELCDALWEAVKKVLEEK